MARTRTPVFLQECSDYHDYLKRGQHGDLALPEYKQNDRGEVVVSHGEVFCRFPFCEHRRNPLSATNNLRAHPRSHRFAIQQTSSGRITQQEKDKAMKWFADIIAASDQATAIATRVE